MLPYILWYEQKCRDTLPELNEKQKRYYAVREAKAYGYGGVALFARSTGMNRDTINQVLFSAHLRSDLAWLEFPNRFFASLQYLIKI